MSQIKVARSDYTQEYYIKGNSSSRVTIADTNCCALGNISHESLFTLSVDDAVEVIQQAITLANEYDDDQFTQFIASTVQGQTFLEEVYTKLGFTKVGKPRTNLNTENKVQLWHYQIPE